MRPQTDGNIIEGQVAKMTALSGISLMAPNYPFCAKFCAQWLRDRSLYDPTHVHGLMPYITA